MSYESNAEKLAKTIMDSWEFYDTGNYPQEYSCYFCEESSWKDYDDIIHDLDCPVLVAKDILVKNN